MRNILRESLQSVTDLALRKKPSAERPAGSGDISQDPSLKNLKRDELLEMLVEVCRENETLKTKLAETEERLTEYKGLLERSNTLADISMRLSGDGGPEASGLTERMAALEEQQREQLELLRKLTAAK